MKKLFKRRSFRILLVIGIILVFILAIFFYRGYTKLNNIKTTKIKESKKELKVNNLTQDKSEKSKIINILLLGVDKEENASDSIIVISIDHRNNKLKLSSIMRDSYIYFGEDKVNKINYAYHYGGPILSIKTLNENYALDIKDYVKVDFEQLEVMVDAIGGIDIDIREEEIPSINSAVSYEKDSGKDYKLKPITKAGVNRLDGAQALAYSRIRKVGNNDYERTERQRRVLSAIFLKVKQMPVTKYEDFLDSLSSSLETSLDRFTILSLAQKAIAYGNNGIESNRVPYDDLKEDVYIKGIYYLKWNKEKNVERLHKFIYGE